MLPSLQTTSIIRQRGQLTIPDSIRAVISWITPGSVVTVAKIKADAIVIRPHATAAETNWNKLWRDIGLSRSHKGNYKGSLSRFITQERETRR